MYPTTRPHLGEEARAAAARAFSHIATPATEDELLRFAESIRTRAPGLAAAALRLVTSSPPPRSDHRELVLLAESLEREAAVLPKLGGIVPQVDPVIFDGLLLEHDRYVAHITRRVFQGQLPGEALTASSCNTEPGRMEAVHEATLVLAAYLAGPMPDPDWKAPIRLRVREPNGFAGATQAKIEVIAREGDGDGQVLLVRTWREVIAAGPYPVAGLLHLLADALSTCLDAAQTVQAGSVGSAVQTERGALALLEGGNLPSDYRAARGVLQTERREQEEAALWRLRDRGFNC